jgi:hypothetical protein
MGLEVRPEEHEGGAQPADGDPHLVHALRVAGGRGGLVGKEVAEPCRDDFPERPRHADVAVQVQIRRFSRGRRPPRPQAVAAVGLALGTDRQRHRRVQVEGQPVERGEHPVPQLELAHRLAWSRL